MSRDIPIKKIIGVIKMFYIYYTDYRFLICIIFIPLFLTTETGLLRDLV